MIYRIAYKTLKKLGFVKTYRSETEKVRDLVLPYCVGYGCDVGFGGDKIKPDAVGIDLPSPYTSVGNDSIDVAADVINGPIPFPDNTFAYVYSSHLIEDYEDTVKALNEFTRVLKDGGTLILVFPDQQVYETICRKRGQPLNQYHKHADMGLTYMHKALKMAAIKDFEVVKEMNLVIDYNVVMVLCISK